MQWTRLNGFNAQVVAPLERLRVQMISDGSQEGMLTCASKVYQKEGIRGFWSGNTLNVGRIAPQQAVAFFAKDFFKINLSGFGAQNWATTLGASMFSGIVCQTGPSV